MKISRSMIRRIVKECGEDMSMPMPHLEPAEMIPNTSTLESPAPTEKELVVEMTIADQSLTAVVESLQNAAQLCTNCSPEIAATAPLVEAMVAQAEALQEMLAVQTNTLLENVGDSMTSEEDVLVTALNGLT
jgi:hypothetical protein